MVERFILIIALIVTRNNSHETVVGHSCPWQSIEKYNRGLVTWAKICVIEHVNGPAPEKPRRRLSRFCPLRRFNGYGRHQFRRLDPTVSRLKRV